jgi:hypothetical protein
MRPIGLKVSPNADPVSDVEIASFPFSSRPKMTAAAVVMTANDEQKVEITEFFRLECLMDDRLADVGCSEPRLKVESITKHQRGATLSLAVLPATSALRLALFCVYFRDSRLLLA